MDFQQYLAYFTPEQLDALDHDAHVATFIVYLEYVDYTFRSSIYAH